MSAHERLMTVKLNISAYDGKKIDRKASSAVEKEFHVQTKGKSKAGDYKANLFPGADEELRAVDRAINALRAFHYANTFRWEPNEQLLPCDNFMNYFEFTSRMKSLIEQRVSEFEGVYDQRVQEALSNRGGLADPGDYPSKAEMRARYNVSIAFGALDSPEDLRLKIPESKLSELREELEKAQNQRLEAAMEDMIERFKKLMEAAKTQLQKTPETGRYHATWQQNLGEFVRAARGLNLSGDQKLSQLFDEAESLCSVDEESLREDVETRNALGEKAQSIYDQMMGVFGAPATN